MLSLNCLTTSNSNLVKSLENYISSAQSSELKGQIYNSLSQISNNRKEIHYIKQFTSDDVIAKYTSYLSDVISITKSFPMMDPFSSLSLSWTSGTNKRDTVTTKNMLYEEMCVLYNLAALYSQKAVNNLNVIIATVDQLDVACDALKWANGYLYVIERELSHVCMNETYLSEIEPNNIQGYRSFLSAQFHFLKAEKAKKVCQNKTKLFMRIYMASHEKYDEALDFFSKSNASLPSDFTGHLHAMSNLAYALALYYEGYMSPEQLDDFNTHGSGKAYYCYTTTIDICEKLQTIRIPSVQKGVMTIAQEYLKEIQKDLKLVLQSWRLRQSTIDQDATGYNMPSAYIADCTIPEITASYDFSIILSDAERQQLEQIEKQYSDYYRNFITQLDKNVMKMKKTISDTIYACNYHPIIEALSNKPCLPPYYDKLLEDFYVKSEKEPLDVLRMAYEAAKKSVNELLEKYDSDYATLIRIMNSNPQRFDPKVENYFRYSIFNYMKTIKEKIYQLDTMETKLKPWIQVTKKKYYEFSLRNQKQMIINSLASNVEMDTSCISEVNAAINRMNKIELFKQSIDESVTIVKRTAEAHRALISAFITEPQQRSSLPTMFDKFFMHVQVLIDQVQTKMNASDGHLRSLQVSLDRILRETQYDSVFSHEYNVLKMLSENDKAYDVISSCYKNNLNLFKELEKNIKVVTNALNSYLK